MTCLTTRSRIVSTWRRAPAPLHWLTWCGVVSIIALIALPIVMTFDRAGVETTIAQANPLAVDQYLVVVSAGHMGDVVDEHGPRDIADGVRPHWSGVDFDSAPVGRDSVVRARLVIGVCGAGSLHARDQQHRRRHYKQQDATEPAGQPCRPLSVAEKGPPARPVGADSGSVATIALAAMIGGEGS